MAKLPAITWVYPMEKTDVESMAALSDDSVGFETVPEHAYFGAPLSGTVSKVDHMEDFGGEDPSTWFYQVEIQSKLPNGDYVYNTFAPVLRPAVSEGQSIKRGDSIGQSGGVAGTYDLYWYCYFNSATDPDGPGMVVNPLDLAMKMGGIQYFSEVAQGTLREEQPAPAKENKVLWLGAAALAWYWMKKGH